jgi:2-polyprenyl-3-methyl-5-hydroxy-6-metoxy-1,4-benzoquinol methylase
MESVIFVKPLRVTETPSITPPASGKKRVGILIITYNAINTLVSVLERIPAHVWDDVEEVAIFDDASHDATHMLAEGYKLLSGNTKVTAFKNDKNLGYGGNQKHGYNYFIGKGFDVVVLLHGDGQYAPEILDHLYKPIINGEAEAVFGSRMMREYGGPLKGRMPLYKFVGNRILTVFENGSLGMNLTEFHSGYRAYSLQALRQVNMTHMTNDFHFDTEIIIKLHHQGLRIKEVPIPTYYGDEISHVNGMRYAKDVARAVLRYKRTVQSVASYPEFAEYFIHYPIKQSQYSSHDLLRKLVGHRQTVLDVGCGEGFFAEILHQNENRITGIDALSAPQQNVFEDYFQYDVNGGLGNAIHGKKFSRILLADILEHLTTPEKVLRDAHSALEPNGQVLVSLPNVANITVRLALLLGRFEYTERGILDKTHVRFFTRRTARRFLEAHGYEVLKQQATVMPLELVLGLPAQNLVMRMITQLLGFVTWLWPSLFGYQLIYVLQSRLTPSSD